MSSSPGDKKNTPALSSSQKNNNSQPTPSQGAHSSQGGSSTATGGSSMMAGAANSAASFRDEAKLQATLKLLSTLEEKTDSLTGASTNDDDVIVSLIKDNSSTKSQGSARDVFNRIERNIIRSLFEINHVLLSNQAVTTIIYHFIMLLEFVQILFFIFYRVEIINEFESLSVSTTTSQSTNQEIHNNLLSNLSNSNDFNQTVYYKQRIFYIDYYFTFLNFELYTLQNQSSYTFLFLYSMLTGIFIAFLIVMFLVANRAFEGSKNEDLKEGEKLLIKVLSIVMTLFLFILQMPFITVLLQGYICDEDPNIPYTLPGITCDSLNHRLLVVFSTFALTMYVIFLVLQQQLYASNNFESTLPWSSMERRLSILRVLYKLVITTCFVFDKPGNSRGYVGLVCFCICAIILYKRSTSALIYRRSVFYATVLYETCSTWLYLVVSLHILFNASLTITSLALIGISSVFFSLINVISQELKRTKYMQIVHPERLQTPSECELYFYRLYETIENTSFQATIEYMGIIYNHVHYCENGQGCPCKQIIESFDGIKKYKRLKQKEMEEEAQIALQQRLERDSTFQENNTSLINMNAEDKEKEKKDRQIAKNTSKNNLNLPIGKSKKFNSKAILGLVRQPTDRKANLSALTQGIRASLHPDHSQDGDEKKKYNTASMAKKLAILMEEQKSANTYTFSEYGEINQKEFIKFRRRQYKFLAILVRAGIEKFPKNIDLKIVNAFIQKSKLLNGFKAVFELMNSELCDPSFHDQFIIFRRKIEVEQNLIKSYHKNAQKIGQIDVNNIYAYEKYQIYEYMTVNAAITFWRELLQKHIDASVLQMKGQEISKLYESIQNVAQKLLQIYPQEVKFLYRYGAFLLNIINNEFDAISNFEKAFNILSNKMQKKNTSTVQNEQSFFGENSAAAIIMISATSTNVGNIIHANDEIEGILGFKRKDVIGKNINHIMPRPIGKVHDKFIHRYFETAKPTVIDIQRQLFGRDKDGYLKEVDLLVKVYPQLTDQIVFVGFLQKAKAFLDMDPPKTEFSSYEQQYIVTDPDGNITNVTEGLNLDLGLNAKFFNYTDSIFQQMFNIQKICPTIMEQSVSEILEVEGGVLEFDTRGILNNIELEQLTSEEILEVRSNLSQQQVFVQLKKLVLDSKFCTILLYRVIVLPKNIGLTGTQNVGFDQLYSKNSGFNDSDFDRASLASAAPQNINQMSVAPSNFSSNSTNALAFNSIIKDFKKALSERQTPSNLVLLNRIVIMILLATIVLSSAIFAIDKKMMIQIDEDNIHSLSSETRTLQIVQLASNIRSLVNIANGIEFERYETGQLQGIDRFNYLSELIQNQAMQLSETHEFMSKQRTNSANLGQGNNIEYNLVDLFRLDSSNKVNEYQQPYRVALSTYLNNILVLNMTKRESLLLQDSILKSAIDEKSQLVYNATSQIQKIAFFLISNGLRSMRTYTEKISDYQRQNDHQFQKSSPFLIIMIIGLIISTFSIMTIFYQIWVIERNKGEILSLYAYLTMKDIGKVYHKCIDFMFHLDKSQLIGTQAIENDDIDQQGDEELDNPNEPDDGSPVIKKMKYKIGLNTFLGSVGAGTRKKDGDSQMSEEEKEAIVFSRYMQRKKLNRLNASNKKQNAFGSAQGAKRSTVANAQGCEQYVELIKRNFEIINEREEELRRKHKEEYTQEAKARQKELLKIQMHGEEEEKPHHYNKEDQEQASNHNQAVEVEKGKKKKRRRLKDIKQDEEMESVKKAKNETDDSEDESEKEEERKERKLEEVENLKKINHDKKLAGEMSKEEVEDRKKNFFRTIKTSNWGTVISNGVIGVIFIGYFLQMSLLHSNLEVQLTVLRKELPIFFDRYRNMILSYSFLRERIINNNSLVTYEYDSIYHNNLDTKYMDLSTNIEQEILKLKTKHSEILRPLTDLTIQSDSENFCQKIIGLKQYPLVNDVISNVVETQSKKVYEAQFKGTISGVLAAERGDVKTLEQLHNSGIDLNLGDYDRRTPLHVAVRAGKFEAVKFLVSDVQVKINQIDRWGATPLSYAIQGSEIYLYMLSRGALSGKFVQKITVRQVIMNDVDYMMFYAASRNDIDTLRGLSQLIIDYNIQDSEGRTALAIAASEGYLESVKFLVQKGALWSIEDARSNNALNDAQREGRVSVIEYFHGIVELQIVMNYCSSFSDGIFNKGVLQAIGNFRKRFADLFIRVNDEEETLDQRLKLLQAPLLNKSSTFQATTYSMQTYFSAQELYFHQIINKYIDEMKNSFQSSTSSYNSIAQLIFLIFLGIQLIILIFLRSRLIVMMKDDIFQSRGILNLIPDDFFEQNRSSVESLIRKLKN